LFYFVINGSPLGVRQKNLSINLEGPACQLSIHRTKK
jgi:hypothetical protein